MNYLIGICLAIAGIVIVYKESVKKDIDYVNRNDYQYYKEETDRNVQELLVRSGEMDIRLMEFEQVPYVEKIKELLKVENVTRDKDMFYFHNSEEIEESPYGFYYGNQYKKSVYLGSLKTTYEELEKNRKELSKEK